MAARVVLRQQILSPITAACLGCKQQVTFELTHCLDCGRSRTTAKQRAMTALILDRVPVLPVTSEEGVRRLLLALFGPGDFDARFKEKALPSPAIVAEVLASLGRREAEVVKRRFGLDGQKCWTLAEIGVEF